ncbi:hypothetical protein CIB87_21335 [Priestia megaterium]|uniref:Uncharacterized protein n=1 Tax=Priestia megaterium TaxID=1404 RepID=A0AA86I407_PRIMG|nr:hypothetical protein [Priestia megaterium]AXI31459.1 hypothetical protein CIB87_21335 [Priestia megaterium]
MNRLQMLKRIKQSDRERWFRTECEIVQRLEDGETKQSISKEMRIHKTIVDSVAKAYKIPYDGIGNFEKNGGMVNDN